jgi:23S rRNA pseudouridine1911/1915/1917 synthase
MTIAGRRTEEIVIAGEEAGERLDRVLAARIEDLSRSRLKALILDGEVAIGARTIRDPGYRVNSGETVSVAVPPPEDPQPQGEDIPLHIVFEDDALIVLDKPKGLVVHPAAGHVSGTLVNALIAHCGDSLSGIGGVRRPGIVHRLDKDTSGLLVMAKTGRAYDGLTAQLVARTVTRRYRAIVHGRVKATEGIVEAPIGRHPRDRVRMAVVTRGKRAVTRYRVLERFSHFSDLDVRLETGRTHQIRVHMASLGHPVAGDDLYGGRTARAPLPGSPEGLALHAAELAFVHPVTESRLQFASPLPPRIERLLSQLRDAG